MDNDSDGELSTGDTDVTVYDWDVRNRLVCVTDYALEGGTATQIVTYLYDAENHWIGENLDTNGDGVVDHETRFAYDGDQIIAQFDKDGAGTVAASDLSHRYVANLAAVDQVLADEQASSGDVLFTLADQLGTVRDLVKVNSSGTSEVVNHRTYDSYGNLTSQSNAAVDCIFGFDGMETDGATGFVHADERWYNPFLGNWMSKDPTGFSVGRDTNTSRFCQNSPTNLTDPSGLGVVDWLSDTWKSICDFCKPGPITAPKPKPAPKLPAATPDASTAARIAESARRRAKTAIKAARGSKVMAQNMLMSQQAVASKAGQRELVYELQIAIDLIPQL